MLTKLVFQVGGVVLLEILGLRLPELIGWAGLNQGSIVLNKSVVCSSPAEGARRDDGHAFDYFDRALARGAMQSYRSLGQVML